MNKVIVKINGADYPIVGEKSESDMIKVGKYVDSEMSKAIASNPKLSISQAAVLTAINITDVFFECCEENDTLTKEIKEYAKKVNIGDDSLKLEIKKHQLKIAQMNDIERESKKSIEDLKVSLDLKSNEINEIKTLLKNNEESLNRMNRVDLDNKKAIKDMTETLSLKDKNLEELKNKLKLQNESLSERDKRNAESEKSINDLTEALENSDKESEELKGLLMNKAESINSYKNEIEDLKRQLEEMQKQAEESQQMCSKFQNDAYRVQLDKIELENKLKFHIAKG